MWQKRTDGSGRMGHSSGMEIRNTDSKDVRAGREAARIAVLCGLWGRSMGSAPVTPLKAERARLPPVPVCEESVSRTADRASSPCVPCSLPSHQQNQELSGKK